MADTIVLTEDWQQIAAGVCVITILKSGSGSLLFNNIGSDVDALPILPNIGDQFDQNQNRTVFVRIKDGIGWSVLVDEAN